MAKLITNKLGIYLQGLNNSHANCTSIFYLNDLKLVLKLSSKKAKYSQDSPYSITERTVPELIPVLGSQSAGDVSHKPGGRLPFLFARPAVTLATLERAATDFAAL